jgi:hypothetical protein
MVFKTASSMILALSCMFMCRSIITAESKRAVGLARSFPAISGAVPWTDSKMLAFWPMLPDGVRPSPIDFSC